MAGTTINGNTGNTDKPGCNPAPMLEPPQKKVETVKANTFTNDEAPFLKPAAPRGGNGAFPG